MSLPLSDLLVPSAVELDLTAANEEEAILSTAALLKVNPAVKDARALAGLVLEREKLSSTSLGHGVAFPHARTNLVSDIVLAVGRSREGVVFRDSGLRVNFVFVIGTPPDRVPQYLALVGRLARLLRDDAVRADLLAANTPEEFVSPLLFAA